MTKKMRELQASIVSLVEQAKSLTEGENKDLAKADALMDQVDALQKEFDTLSRIDNRSKDTVKDLPEPTSEDGFKLMAKMFSRKPLSDREKDALITGTDATQGENYLIPDDVYTAIQELRQTYVSAKTLVNVIKTASLSGGINYEAGVPAGLTAFDDGDDLTVEDMSFLRKTFTIAFYGKLIPISRILVGAERADLLGYLNRWFVKNAIITENAAIFSALASGYNSGTAKPVEGYAALKASIITDVDPSCLLDGVLVTNQSGFACLDAEVDADGRPVLQPNPAQPTAKLFYGLPVVVFPDAQLATLAGGEFPMFYGSLKAGATFVEYQNIEFAMSEHALFGKNQNCMRVVEGFDVVSTDTDAYVYAAFEATPAS